MQVPKKLRNPYVTWQNIHVVSLREYGLYDLYRKDGCPETGGFDTETTGLHIKKDKPFLFQLGWLIKGKQDGRVFTFYPTPENMKVFFAIAKHFKYFVGHNIKYDLHMAANLGYLKQVESLDNYTENQAVMRLVLEAVPAREGGPVLRLKKLGETYIHPDAGKSEYLIKQDIERMQAERIKVLTAALKQFDHPTETVVIPIRNDTGTKTTKTYASANPKGVQWKRVPRKWGKGLVEAFLKDPTHDVDDLPEDVREVWVTWQEEYPPPTYEDVDRELLIKYGGEDVITMLELFRLAFPFVIKRKQLDTLKLENDLILPLFRMEREGMKVDMGYLENSRRKTKAYIKKLREEMSVLAGEPVTVGQHERLQAIFREKWGMPLEDAQGATMKQIADDNFKVWENDTPRRIPAPKEAQRFAKLIQMLRTAEKWFSTYIKRVQAAAQYDGRVYTQINSTGAVSGRMSSDLQQFPKDELTDEDGNHLFHARRAFVVDLSRYEMQAYVDYSQVELRAQAHYTIKVMGGDVNMVRAYMPFRCIHYKTGEIYQYSTSEHRARWDDRQPNGSSAWLIPETGEPWTPTDNHSETTHNALVLLGYECIKKYEEYRATEETTEASIERLGEHLDKKEFKKHRGDLGKRFNFSKNYGVGLKTAMRNLDVAEAVAQALIDGFSEAFPGVLDYQKAIEKAHRRDGYVPNAYGRRYYIKDMRKSYKLANHVVQGSCADALKKAIIALDRYIRENNLRTRMILPVHDEQIFGIGRGESGHIDKFVEIMQGVFKGWCLVPIVSEPEVSTTTWLDKTDWEGAKSA